MKVKINLSQLLYYISFVVVVFVKFISQTMFADKYNYIESLSNIAIVVACGILVIKYFVDRHTNKELVLATIVSVIGIIVSYESGDYFTLLPLVLLIISVKNIDVNRVLKIWLIEITCLVLFVFISYKLGIIGDANLWVRDDGTLRYSLGYTYSTFGANYLLYITIFYIYIRKNKITYIEILLLLLTNTYIYNLTNTKAAFFYSIVCVLLAAIIKICNIDKQINWLNKYSILVSAIIAILASYMYRYGFVFLDELNKILTGRLYLGSSGFDEFRITLFGQKITWINQQEDFSQLLYNYVDSSYLNILFNYGVVLLSVIIVGYYFLAKMNISKNIYYTAMILCISLHSMFDPQLIAIMYNPAILFLGYLVTGENVQKINL